jgi:hypothetical protein
MGASRAREPFDGWKSSGARSDEGEFEISAAVRPSDQVTRIEITCDSPPGWGASKGEDRDLTFLLSELRAEH